MTKYSFNSEEGTPWELVVSQIRPDMDQSGQHTNGPIPYWIKKVKDKEWSCLSRQTMRELGVYGLDLVTYSWSDNDIEAFIEK